MGAGEIKAGGAYVQLGADDARLVQALDAAGKKMKAYSQAAATWSNKAASHFAIAGGRIRSIATGAFSAASKAAGLFFAPLKLVTSGLVSLGRAAVSVASSIASIAWRNVKIGALAAAAAIGIAIKTFASFQTQLAMVSTMLGGGAGEHGLQLDQFKADLKSLSIEMGESTATLAKGLYDILSASIPASEAMGVLTVAARAARAGLTDTGTAADVITTVLNAYSLSADKAADVSDWLFAVVKRGKTSFGELAANVGRVATLAAKSGISLEEFGAAVTVMTRVGVKAEDSLTALQAIISTFLNPSEKAMKMAKELGFEMSTAALKSMGLVGVFKKISEMPPDMVSKLFPNVRALRGVIPALANMAGFVEDISGLSKRAGEADEAFRKMTATLAHAFNVLKQGFIILVAEIGEIFGPAMDEAIDIFVDWVKTARTWIEVHGEDLKWYVDDAWETIKEIVSTAWTWIKDNVLSIVEGDFSTQWEKVKAGARTLWETMKTIFKTGQSIVSTVVDIVKMFFEDPAAAGKMVADAFNDVWEIAAGAIDFTRGSGLLDKLAEFFGGLVDRLKTTGFVDKLMGVIAEAFKLSGKLWTAAYTWAKKIGAAILEGLFLAWEGGEIEGLSPETLAKAKARGFELNAPGQPSVPLAAAPVQPSAFTGQTPEEAAYQIPVQTSGIAKRAVQQTINITARNPLAPDVAEDTDRASIENFFGASIANGSLNSFTYLDHFGVENAVRLINDSLDYTNTFTDLWTVDMTFEEVAGAGS